LNNAFTSINDDKTVVLRYNTLHFSQVLGCMHSCKKTAIQQKCIGGSFTVEACETAIKLRCSVIAIKLQYRKNVLQAILLQKPAKLQ